MDAKDTEITTDELGWDEAVVQEGRRPGAVVSVRLDADETEKLRALADRLGLNISQVVRRALAAYEAKAGENEADERFVLGAFTYGGTPAVYDKMWSWVAPASQLAIFETEDARRGAGDPAPTSTEPTRIVERMTS